MSAPSDSGRLWTYRTWLVAAVFVAVALPFVFSSVERWDLVAHLQEAEFQLEMLPSIVYWNPYVNLGYEPFSSYALLPRLLTAIFGLVFGVGLALKLFLVVSWTAYPFALRFLFESFLDETKSFAALCITAGCLFATSIGLGYGFYSAFLIGNFASIIGFPLFLVALALILRQRYLGAAVMVGVTLLTHVLSGLLLVAIVMVAAYVDRRAWRALTGIGVAGIWVIPALWTGYYDVATYGELWSTMPIFVGPFVLFNLIWAWLYGSSRVEDILLFSALGIFGATVYAGWDIEGWKMIPIHYHRLYIPMGIFVLILTLDKVDITSRSKAIGVSLAALVTGLLIGLPNIERAYFHSQVESVPVDEADRMFILNDPFYGADVEERLNWHNVNYDYIRHHQMSVLPGLFIEASPEGEFIFAVQEGLAPTDVAQWGAKMTRPFPRQLRRRIRENSGRIFELLGVDTSVVLKGCGKQIKPSCIKSDSHPSSLVDIPRQLGAWDSRPRDRVAWLFRPSPPVYGEGAPTGANSGEAKVIEKSEHLNELEVSVDSSSEIPIHVKISYSKAWHAETVDGESLEVDKAFPAGMIVETSEDFVLKHKALRLDTLFGGLLTLFSIGGLGIWWFKRRQVRQRTERSN